MAIRILALATLLATGSASAAQHAGSFAEAQKIYDYQAKDAAIKAYTETWSAFNNAHHLDEKDGCWPKPGGPLVQILEIDSTGKVVGYYSDKINSRSKCWRKSYLGVIFPAPPIAPLFLRFEMP